MLTLKYRTIVCLIWVFVSMLTLHAQDDTAQALQDALSKGLDNPQTAAVVTVTTPNGHWNIVQGVVDIHTNVPVVATDRFRIGSTSKTFVAVVALQLVEKGLLDLDARARDWLPMEVVQQLANAKTVTVRQLLAMRSGIPEYLNDAFIATVLDNPTRIWTPTDALAYAYGKKAYFEADTSYLYTNTNYVLVQLILEQVSGKPLHQLVREGILDPLQLVNTYTQVHETLDGGFVHAYSDVDTDGQLDDVTAINDGAGLGDGGLVSTTADLTRFYQALFQEQSLLNEESMNQLLDFKETGEEGQRYSLGLDEFQTDLGVAIGHPGSVIGFGGITLYFPDQQSIISVLFAQDYFDVRPMLSDMVLAVFATR